MARAEVQGNGAGNTQDPEISPEVETQAADLVAARTKEEERPRRSRSSRVLTAADRDRIYEGRSLGRITRWRFAARSGGGRPLRGADRAD